MKQRTIVRYLFLCWCLLLVATAGSAQAASSAILGWNNLGMHCMDSDYSVFSILPPYNTIEAQLIVGGQLVKSGTGYTLTYQAIADPTGSINTSSIGKGNWGQFGSALYGIPATYTADMGLVGWNMPGPANTPRSMTFETNNSPAAGVSALVNWYRAEGIPITPFDDAGKKNYYPMMRITAKNSTGATIATSDIVLPVSDEMDCRVCHASGVGSAAMPAAGWVFDANPERDFRLNILRLHDERQFADHRALYVDALAAKSLNAAGLYATVQGGKPILCASCHASEALGAPSFSSSNGTVPQLTTSVHSAHADVRDPVSNLALNDAGNRNACYRCHPGSATRCLRGAMGSAVAADGTMEMQCQSCHGTLSQVGDPARTGWFQEPTCQSCHTGTATHNNGQIRYASVFDASGAVRVPVDSTFATNADTPATGLSLYRFSAGHGGLQCSACHGSTHAEFPTSHTNDNIRNVQLQGHGGTTVECTACHATTPSTANGGPHGMHPIGQSWVSGHHDMISAAGGRAACQACHGTDYRGTVLSRVQGDRALSFGGTSFTLYRGATIGCYTCHNGPSSESANTAAAPVVSNVSASTVSGQPVSMTLTATGANAVLRIIGQPANGSVGLVNNVATYFPADGFYGTDTFTFAAYDGAKNSNLGTGTISVAPPQPPVITGNPASLTVLTGSPASFTVAATGTGPLSYQWYKNSTAISGATGASYAIAATTTADSGTYYATVSNSAGSVTSTGAVLTVRVPAPAISSFTPASGPVGTTVTITGSNFTGATRVAFNGTAASSYSVTSATQITATVPTGATSGAIAVTTTGGTATSSTNFSVTSTTTAAPRISGFSPSSGPVGTKVKVSGSNLAGVVSAKIGSLTAPFSITSATTVVVTIPTGATSGRISLTAPGGTATSTSSFRVTKY